MSTASGNCTCDARLCGGCSTNEWTLIPLLLHFESMLLLNSDKRINFLIIMRKHLPKVGIVLHMLLHILFRDRALDTQEVLKHLKVFWVNFFQLSLPVIIFPDRKIVPQGRGRPCGIHHHSIIQRVIWRRRGESSRALSVAEAYFLIRWRTHHSISLIIYEAFLRRCRRYRSRSTLPSQQVGHLTSAQDLISLALHDALKLIEDLNVLFLNLGQTITA